MVGPLALWLVSSIAFCDPAKTKQCSRGCWLISQPTARVQSLTRLNRSWIQLLFCDLRKKCNLSVWGGVVGGVIFTSWKTHCVERRARNLVIWQVIDRIFPQGKARSSFCQHERYTWWCSTASWTLVEKQHRNSSVYQTPIFLPHSLIEIR